jgi:glycine oxidase
MNVLIIGGGVIGLSIAYELHTAGVRDITVVDRSAAGMEASWAAAGMLAATAECCKFDEFFELCSESAAMYQDLADKLQERTGIDIGYRRSGTLQVAFTSEQAREISEKFELQKAAGVRSELLSADGIRKLEPGLSASIVAGAHYPDDHYVDNRSLLNALLDHAKTSSIQLIEHTLIDRLSIVGDRVTGAIAGDREFAADVTILATGAWTSDIELGLGERLNVRPVKGQMIALVGGSVDLTHVVYGPDRYIVPRHQGRVLVGATVEDAAFDRTVYEAVSEHLHRAAVEIFPMLSEFHVADSWTGFRPATGDELPLLGRLPGREGAFVATGHYRNGILLAPITARIIADEVLGKKHSRYLDAFGPSRIRDRAAGSPF